MESLFSDIRYAVRSLLKRPGFTAIALVTLALGIGANSAIFSTVNALLINPLPFPHLDRIVAVWDKNPSRGVERNEVSMADYLDWKAQSQSFEQLALERWWSMNLTAGDTPERVQGQLVTANFFDVVGVKPFKGRAFLEEENQPGKDGVAIITHSLGERRFGSDPNILNKTVMTNGVARTVVGVLPPEFSYPKGSQIYAPIALTPEIIKSRRFHTYYVIGKLKPNVTLQKAQAEMDTITARLAAQYPVANTGLGANIFPVVADTVRVYSTAMWGVMAD